MAATVAMLALTAAPAAQADGLQAGQWKVITKPQLTASPGRRCRTSLSLRHRRERPGKDLQSGQPHHQLDLRADRARVSPQRLKWRLQCTGQIDMDVAGEFVFDNPEHYTATVTARSSMMGRVMNSIALSPDSTARARGRVPVTVYEFRRLSTSSHTAPQVINVVMAGPCPGHPRLACCSKQDVDARNKCGHDELGFAILRHSPLNEKPHRAGAPGGLRCELGQCRGAAPTASRSARQQHSVDHVDHAVRLHYVLDGDLGAVALGVGIQIWSPLIATVRSSPSTVLSMALPPLFSTISIRSLAVMRPGTT